MSNWINKADTTVDQSWQSAYDILGLSLIDNPNELIMWENLKSDTGIDNPAYVKILKAGSVGARGDIGRASYSRGWNNPGVDPDTLYVFEDDLAHDIIAEGGGHASDFTKKGTISSYDAYGDSLSFQLGIESGLYGDDVYGRGGDYGWYEDEWGKIHREGPLQYIDINSPGWKIYEPGVTKRGDTPIEFWTHNVLEDQYWDLLAKAREKDTK